MTIQLDELWSFVGNKTNKQWVWLAMDVSTREIVGCYVGNRTRAAAKKLWESDVASKNGGNLQTRSALLHTNNSIQGCPHFYVVFSWQSLPAVYRQCAVCYRDIGSAYEQVIPHTRHRAVRKDTGKTSLIERFNNTLRQRVGRLVRKTLSFSKKLSNHLGAIWDFVHYYNASLRS